MRSARVRVTEVRFGAPMDRQFGVRKRRQRTVETRSASELVAGALDDGDGSGSRRARMTAALRALTREARAAGKKAVTSGQWLTETSAAFAEHLPIRDEATLIAHHQGKSGTELAEALIRNAGIASGAVGGVAGALIGVEELVPHTWATVPFELAAETALVVAIEMKLVAELHEALGRPIPGAGPQRGLLFAQSWAEKRGVNPQDLILGVGAADIFGRQARVTLTVAIRRRLTHRLGRSMATLIPLMAGAVAGAVLNRRATVAIGETVAADLAREGIVVSTVVPGPGWATA